MNKRRDPRFQTRFDTLISAGRTEGAGQLIDLSYSGARLDGVSLVPEIGARVRLYVFIQPVAPFELVGYVVRQTEGGFAIEYEVDDPDIRRLVDDAAAIVATL